MNLFKKEKKTNTGNKLWLPNQNGWGGINQEVGIYTVLDIKQVTIRHCKIKDY